PEQMERWHPGCRSCPGGLPTRDGEPCTLPRRTVPCGKGVRPVFCPRSPGHSAAGSAGTDGVTERPGIQPDVLFFLPVPVPAGYPEGTGYVSHLRCRLLGVRAESPLRAG